MADLSSTKREGTLIQSGVKPIALEKENSEREFQRLNSASGMNLVDEAQEILTFVRHIPYVDTIESADMVFDEASTWLSQYQEGLIAKGEDKDVVHAAHFCLCCLLDEAIMRTPWGDEGKWAQRTLLYYFHEERNGGEYFFNVLTNARAEPQRFRGLLHLLFRCLALGFMGKYKIQQDGSIKLKKLYHSFGEELVELESAKKAKLSPKWRPTVLRGNRQLSRLSLWVALPVMAMLLIGGYLIGSIWNSLATEPVTKHIAQISAPTPLYRIDPIEVPQQIAKLSVTPPPQKPAMSLATLLAEEISAGELVYTERDGLEIVRFNGALFDTGSNSLATDFKVTLSAIASALNLLPGPVEVSGHTDNVPIRTVKYPSNWALSSARADAVATELVNIGVDGQRITAIGQGDNQPIGDNATSDGRALNRRVEISLRHMEGL
ncbi:type IVB secretion system protein IcmH/DotU [Paraferrimonas sedimenticola]|uniref:OmpA-like domain-containing protein n=1 Tax=Paraferrimonas sedimenticola TaxID=375674 RepID=A0AA37VYQ0_9GAMM|nr:type IVB secretion system protein IcmH/DotU [Paraferrimonas sedimenticola]GLP96834.1 hypothetical protein GCM10007895_21400 [Paraferrimonas sedimenticola]